MRSIECSQQACSRGKGREQFKDTNLDVDLVAAQNHGDVLANAFQVSVPVGDILVCDSRSDIEHDDTALALDVVTIAETTELLLSCRVPDVEADRAKVGVELERVYLDTERRNVLLLELARQVTLDKGRLTRTAVA